MAILPSGDIPENPWRQNSASGRPTRTAIPPLPVTEELYETLNRPVPTPSNDWFAIFRNVFIALGVIAVVVAFAVVAITSGSTESASLQIDPKRASQQHTSKSYEITPPHSSISLSGPSLNLADQASPQAISSLSSSIQTSLPQVYSLQSQAPSSTPSVAVQPASPVRSYVPSQQTSPVPSYVPATPVARTAASNTSTWQVSTPPPVLRRSSPKVPLLPDPDFR